MTDDLISRQAAITTLCERRCGNKPKGCPSGFCTESLAVDCIPSAQPEPCEDAVSRRRLLGDLKELISAWKKYPVMAEQIKGVETAIGYVERIPPVTPQPEQRWIPVTERLPEQNMTYHFDEDAMAEIPTGIVKSRFVLVTVYAKKADLHSWKGRTLSEREVLQMQKESTEKTAGQGAADEEPIDVLIAISVVAKRLAKKLQNENKEESQHEQNE